MSRIGTLLTRLPWPPADGLRVPSCVPPDPGSRTGAWIVAIGTAVAAFVYLVGNLREAAALTPEFTRTILTQVGTSSVPLAFRESIGMQSLPGPLVEFAVAAYQVLFLYGVAALFPAPAAPTTIVVLRSLVEGLNLLGAPMLFLAARRSGLRDRPAALAAVMYLLSPFLADKIGWDLIGYMGTPLIAAWWALVARRPWVAFGCWLVAAGGHPFSLWGITFWALGEWVAAERSGRPSTALRVAAAWFPIQALANFAIVFAVPLFSPGSLAAYLRDHVASQRFRAGILPMHGLAVVGLMAGYLFLPFARARWLVLVGADMLYYLGTGLSHGLIPSTTGFLALASVEALRAAQAAPVTARRGPFTRIAALVSDRPDSPPRAALLALGIVPLALVAANTLMPAGNAWRRAVVGVEWDGAWIPGVESVVASVPADVELCLSQPFAFAAVDGRCPRVLPWAWPETGEFVDPGKARTAYVLSVDLFDRQRYPQRTLLGRRDHEVRRRVCDGLERGHLAVAAVSAGGCLLVPSGTGVPSGVKACPGLCPAPEVEGEGEFRDREPRAPVPGGSRPPPPGPRPDGAPRAR